MEFIKDNNLLLGEEYQNEAELTFYIGTKIPDLPEPESSFENIDPFQFDLTWEVLPGGYHQATHELYRAERKINYNDTTYLTSLVYRFLYVRIPYTTRQEEGEGFVYTKQDGKYGYVVLLDRIEETVEPLMFGAGELELVSDVTVSSKLVAVKEWVEEVKGVRKGPFKIIVRYVDQSGNALLDDVEHFVRPGQRLVFSRPEIEGWAYEGGMKGSHFDRERAVYRGEIVQPGDVETLLSQTKGAADEGVVYLMYDLNF